MHPVEGHDEIQLSAQGRLVIPAALRRALGFQSGDKLIVYQEDGRLVLEKSSTIKRRLKQRFDHIPKGDSLADELISERRLEARREAGE
ncbi:MAG: AbrB/MazE/SpoVT family DNA-binding domain-containing protein [Gammaproteobacteria bacterium]|nr:AbrB/MazE/SpoVT family DNA-binding domain-containing protein [Gammaproteobacteria bacterium]